MALTDSLLGSVDLPMVLISLAITVIVKLAWMSSNVRDTPRLVQAAVIVQRESRNNNTNNNQSNNPNNNQSNNSAENASGENGVRRRHNANGGGGTAQVIIAEASNREEMIRVFRGEDQQQQPSESPAEQRQDSARTISTESSTVENENSESTPAAAAASPQQEGNSTSDQVDNAASEADSNEPNVTIKIKYLDDTQKEATGKLSEELGKFKRRYFTEELSRNERVRLIFNGHVLADERKSLGDHGLYDECVVHCLISAPLPGAQQPQNQAQSGQRTASQQQGSPNNRSTTYMDISEDLDLSQLCYPMFGAILVVFWWCQLVYSHYFSFTSSISLILLTALFLASVTNSYLY